MVQSRWPEKAFRYANKKTERENYWHSRKGGAEKNKEYCSNHHNAQYENDGLRNWTQEEDKTTVVSDYSDTVRGINIIDQQL